MNIKSLENVKIDIESGLFDLTQTTWKDFRTVEYQYEVQLNEEMRMDLVCMSIFDGVNDIDFIMNYNGIDNPLNVMPGDNIIYVKKQEIISGDVIQDSSETLDRVIRSRRSTRIDPNRKKYIDNDKSITPTLNEIPKSSVGIVGNNIIIGGNS